MGDEDQIAERLATLKLKLERCGIIARDMSAKVKSIAFVGGVAPCRIRDQRKNIDHREHRTGESNSMGGE
jgi:hypothetical protein